MLPKVATHILHTTSRAAAQVVQTPLRNVLQTSSSTGSNLGNRNGAGGSNWGGHGTGAGSAKQNTGNRYYSSFNTAGRAVSQANAVSAVVDGTFSQSDENDEHGPRRVVVIQGQSGPATKRPRIRSSSVSLTKAESLGVLKTLQLQGRSRFLHTAIDVQPQSHLQPLPPFTPSRPRRKSTSSTDGLDRPSSPIRNFSIAASESGSQDLPIVVARPRRNSTSSTDSMDMSAFGHVDSAINQLEQVVGSPQNSESSSIDDHEQSDASSVENRSTTPPSSPKLSLSSRSSTPSPSSHQSSGFSYLVEAKDSGDVHRVAEAVARFRSSPERATTEDFNTALEALYATREGESAMPMLETYHDMIKHSVHPNIQTYNLLIMSLSERDTELKRAIEFLSRNLDRLQPDDGSETADTENLKFRIDILQSEFRDNLSTVMSLYSVATKTVGALSVYAHGGLLRACLNHGNVDAGVQVFRHAEQLFPKLQPQFYRSMIQMNGLVKNVTSAENVFNKYVTAGREQRLDIDYLDPENQRWHLLVWRAMIEAYFQCGLPDKAIGLLDQMLKTPSGIHFTFADVPLPAGCIYSAILRGFCTIGDTQTAMIWYDRLSRQGKKMEHPFQPSRQAIKPNIYTNIAMVDALTGGGHIAELNQIYGELDFTSEAVRSRAPSVCRANMKVLSQDATDAEQAKNILQFLTQTLQKITKPGDQFSIAMPIALEYIRRGLLDEALTFYADFFRGRMRDFTTAENLNVADQEKLLSRLRTSLQQFLAAYFNGAVEPDALTIESVQKVFELCADIGAHIPVNAKKYVLHTYAVARSQGKLPIDKLSSKFWEEMLFIALKVESIPVDPSVSQQTPAFEAIPNYAFGGLFSLVHDLATFRVDIRALPTGLMKHVIRHLISVHGPHLVIGAFEGFSPAFKELLEETGEISSLILEGKLDNSPVKMEQDRSMRRSLHWRKNLIITPGQTKDIDETMTQKYDQVQVISAYDKLQVGLEKRIAPSPRVLARLIQGLGRQGELEKAHEVYATAQEVLKGLEMQQDAMRDGWIRVEDSMVVALAHAGDVDNAHAHRMRLISQGAAPSADAYGALILNVKDTTDDASNAMMLFNEAVQANVHMNIYLYNNIISKLAKARKADHALELFHRMKAEGVKPTSITYGALIGACARVGDIQSAEALFAEMVDLENFKPRVPPYNTMMQLYTATKPNRERALWFYEQMKTAGVKPTAHTYKLLLDAFGTIEPIDITSMEATFKKLKNDPGVKVQGTHYASLIYTYGCVQRDLDKAIATLNSISFSSGSTPGSSKVLDAVVFEAIINVLVSHRRTDLLPEYLDKMTSANVHMTAYIANFLIKGYALVGELDKAREVFESLVDPPTGVAAPNNHAPHDPSIRNAIGCTEPVYREPSTWEAMVRAELGRGNHDRALDLLHRLKSRQYPEAVYNRISGVMVDFSSLLD